MKKIISILLSISILCGSGILVAADTLENEGTTVYYEIETDEDVLLEMAIEQAKERTITTRSAIENTEEFMVDQLESVTTYSDGSKVEQRVATVFDLRDEDLNKITAEAISEYGTQNASDGYIDCYVSTSVSYEFRELYNDIRVTRVTGTTRNGNNKITSFRCIVKSESGLPDPAYSNYLAGKTFSSPSSGAVYSYYPNNMPFYDDSKPRTFLAGVGYVYVNGTLEPSIEASVDLLTIIWLKAHGNL